MDIVWRVLSLVVLLCIVVQSFRMVKMPRLHLLLHILSDRNLVSDFDLT
jgi:hypothetical protein